MSDIKHGEPAWMDLSTTDVDAAEVFYRELLGWEFLHDDPELGEYRMVERGGYPVGGAMSSAMGTDDAAAPEETGWTVFLKVDDITEATAKVVEAGGHVTMAPMKISDLGTTAMITDPTGAALGLWEPAGFGGFATESGPGIPVWFEVMTTDFDAAVEFYGKVFGWRLRDLDGDVRYATTLTAGIRAGTRSHWRMYVQVVDVDAGVDKLRELGGALLSEPGDTPFGRVAGVADPQGASFQLIQP
ncbi:VOC family protein [Corynebacterium sp. YIM 101645]|uniref:VOC family protein n=1 Tax=Corynebacterium lemuris TaxID=1859292 RepID=A0ABT2FTG3_9CORY|nr:VOC family protein [Corynebacterium lemuris]MCS5478239.1 VOC family protein [Corynebacterium lemuris]